MSTDHDEQFTRDAERKQEDSSQPKKPRGFRRPGARLRAIKALILLIEKRRAGENVIVFVDSQQIRTADELAICRAKQLGLSARTLWRWLARFREFGMAGLANGPAVIKDSPAVRRHTPIIAASSAT